MPSEVGSSHGTASTSQLSQDLKGLGLDDDDVYTPEDTSALPTISIAKEKLIEEIKQKELDADYKPVLSMVVIGMLTLAEGQKRNAERGCLQVTSMRGSPL